MTKYLFVQSIIIKKKIFLFAFCTVIICILFICISDSFTHYLFFMYKWVDIGGVCMYLHGLRTLINIK
jgi:hypothetical protein